MLSNWQHVNRNYDEHEPSYPHICNEGYSVLSLSNGIAVLTCAAIMYATL
jgi:hypothetical protein